VRTPIQSLLASEYGRRDNGMITSIFQFKRPETHQAKSDLLDVQVIRTRMLVYRLRVCLF